MRRRRRFDWSDAVDVTAAVKTCRGEMYGDWVRDPWSWPELALLVDEPNLVLDRLNAERTRFERLAVPKINFGTRPAVTQLPVDRVAYHAVVNTISTRVSGELAPFVRGWRLSRKEPLPGRTVNNEQEWLAFIAERRDASERYPAVLATDITNFFGSVQSEQLLDLIYRRAGNTKPVQAVENFLHIFNALPDRSGLPQRSTASSILANAFLGPIDDILQRYADTHDARPLRWMDDVWVFSDDPEQLRCLQLALQDELRMLGLEMNLGKTKIREGEEARLVVQENDLERDPPRRNAAVSGEPFVASHHERDLDRQFELFSERPELADRTVIRYICARIRDFHRDDLVPAVIDAVPFAPQGADHFSRLLAKTGWWRDLGSWYVDQSDRPIGLSHLSWPISQLGTMFPSETRIEPVANLFAESLEDTRNPAPDFLAVAAHRLSRWQEADARVLLRKVGTESDSPSCRRIAGIALHNLGEDRNRVRAILGEFEENQDTKMLLDSRGNRRVPENRDFDPAVN